MSPLATVILAWAAVYAYVCVYFCVLYAHRPSDRVCLAFGLLSGALAVYAVGSALLTDASTVEEAALAMTVKTAGVLPGVAFAVHFCHQLVGKRSPRVLGVAYAWAAAGFVLAVAGLAVDAGERAPPPTWGFAWAPDYPEAALSPIGQVVSIGAWCFVAYALRVLVGTARRERDVRLILWSFVANIACGAHDTAILIGSLRSVYLLEHGTMLSVVATSYLLVDRFVRTGERLTTRTLELRSSYDELRHTQEELVHKEQLAAVGELSAVIAHEVRNPLAVIKNSVSGLRREVLGAEDRDTLLSILDEELNRLNRLVNDLLAHARPAAPRDREVPLAELVQRAIDLARRGRSHAGDVEVVVDCEGGPPTVRGDPDLLRNAFVHIVENALQAMTKGGRLSVRAQSVGLDGATGVRIDFRDTGEGVDPAVREKARDPFLTSRPAGTGLGLAIVERVLRTHGGRLEIESRHRHGTTVSVFLPAERPPTAPEPRPAGRPARSET